jgi:CYTH domain-containing protein
MTAEIERKYLVESDAWRALPTRVQEVTQAYVRDTGADDRLTIIFNGNSRAEIALRHGDKVHSFKAGGVDFEKFAALRELAEYDADSGALDVGHPVECRVRVVEEAGEKKAYLTIKKFIDDPEARGEYEIAMPVVDAEKIIAEGLVIDRVDKTRSKIDYQGNHWDVDVYKGRHKGLVTAEVEVADIKMLDTLPKLPGAGRVVSGVEFLNNRMLGRNGLPPDWRAQLDRLRPRVP